MKELARCAVATVHEALGQIGALDRTIQAIAPGMRLCGRALTVRCHPGDNLMLIKAISMAGPDDVLVVDPGDRGEAGPFGEVLAVDCLAHGVAGLVTAGSVRDSEAIEKSDAREAKERTVMKRLEAGEHLFDIYGYQATLDRLGCTEE